MIWRDRYGWAGPVLLPTAHIRDPILPHSTPLKVFSRLTGDYAHATYRQWGFFPLCKPVAGVGQHQINYHNFNKLNNVNRKKKQSPLVAQTLLK